MLTARFPTQALFQPQRQAATAYFRRLTQDNDILIACEAVFADTSAPLLELSSPQAEWGIWPLFQEAAYVRPTMVTVQTLVEPGSWSRP